MAGFSAGSAALFRQILAVAGVSGGDRGILSDRLWSFHGGLLAFLRYRTGSEELAEDLLSETYLAFLKSNPPDSTFRDDTALRNYLMTMALNKLRDHYRRAANRPERRLQFRTREELELWLEQLADRDSDPAALVVDADEEGQRRRLVASVMASLPNRYREVLGLKFTQDLANPEIARRLDLGIKAVESLLVRAKAAFRKEFEAQSLANETAATRVDGKQGGRS